MNHDIAKILKFTKIKYLTILHSIWGCWKSLLVPAASMHRLPMRGKFLDRAGDTHRAELNPFLAQRTTSMRLLRTLTYSFDIDTLNTYQSVASLGFESRGYLGCYYTVQEILVLNSLKRSQPGWPGCSYDLPQRRQHHLHRQHWPSVLCLSSLWLMS